MRRVGIPAAALCAAVAFLLPGAVRAQAYQCRPPDRIASPPPVRIPAGEARRLPITGYTLALSWSPEFCRTRSGDSAQKLQCGGGMGRFGFIVHGLWPESKRTWPQWCRTVPAPDPAVVRGQLCRSPSAKLIGHAWAKHGSCMARTPGGYFKVSNILADSLSYPDMERLSRERSLHAGALRRALAAANPGRPPGSFGIRVNRNGWLQEVWLCLDRRFRSVRCPPRQAGPPDAAPLKIWRGL